MDLVTKTIQVEPTEYDRFCRYCKLDGISRGAKIRELISTFNKVKSEIENEDLKTRLN